MDVGNATTGIRREGINSHHKISNRGLCNRIVLKSGLCLDFYSIPTVEVGGLRLVVFFPERRENKTLCQNSSLKDLFS